jgi:hypothetical protein
MAAQPRLASRALRAERHPAKSPERMRTVAWWATPDDDEHYTYTVGIEPKN